MSSIDQIERAKRVSADAARALTLRREVQQAATKLDRLIGTFQAGARLAASKSGPRLLKMAALLGQYEAIEEELRAQYHPTPAARVALKMIDGLKDDARRIFRADPNVREIAGQGVGIYEMARLVRHFAEVDTKPTARRSNRQASSKREKRYNVPAGVRRVLLHKDASGPRLVVTASSTRVDLEGDAMSRDVLKQMVAYYPGRLAFLNHNYSIPESVAGKITNAKIVKRGDYHDLDLVIAVEMGNPRAVQTLDIVKGGTAIGVSVGVIVVDSEKQKDGTTLITDVKPLEVSLVGIPALQSAFTQGAK